MTAAKLRTIAGWVLISLVGAILILAGAAKLFGLAPVDVVETLTKAHLIDYAKLIGARAMVTGVLLMVPATSSVGLLFASAYWGGAIVTHLTIGDSFLPPAILLVATWVGSGLRDPRSFSSFLSPTG